MRIDDQELVAALTERKTKARYERHCPCGKVIPAHTKKGIEKLWKHHLATKHPDWA